MTQPPPSPVGAFLRQLRLAHSLTLRDVSHELGLRSPSHLHNLEQGLWALNARYQARLARVYDLPPAALDPTAPPVAATLPLRGHPALVAAVRALAARLGVLDEGPSAEC